MRMAVPAAYGGPEADPLTMLSAIETVARADGAAGWCTMIASTTSSQCAVPAAGHAPGRSTAIRRSSPAACSPRTARARSSTTASRSTGRWQWGSGTQHCQWILGGTSCDDDTFRLCWFEAGRRDVPRHVVHVRAARHGVARLLRRRRRACRSTARSSRGAAGRRSTSRWPASRTSRCSPPASPRSASASAAERIDELVALAEGKRPQFSSQDAGRERLHADRAGPGRGRAALGAGVPARRGRPGVGPCRRRRPGRRRRPRRHPPRRRQRRGCAAPRSPTSPTRSPAGRACTSSSVLQRCLRDAHVPTQHLRSRRSCTRPPAASSSARTSTRRRSEQSSTWCWPGPHHVLERQCLRRRQVVGKVVVDVLGDRDARAPNAGRRRHPGPWCSSRPARPAGDPPLGAHRVRWSAPRPRGVTAPTVATSRRRAVAALGRHPIRSRAG